jgi:Ca2+-binding RTX toxin-like protein
MKIIGSNFGDLLSGTSKSDVIYGNAGGDYLFANGAAITTGSAREQVYAGSGADFIGGFSLKLDDLKKSPSLGSLIDGGSGHDTLFVGISSGNDVINLGNVTGALQLRSVEDRIYDVQGSDNQKIFGTNIGETIVGSPSALNIDASGGNDYVFASSENDVINGGAGNDFLHAGEGHNIVTGGKGSDYFHFYFENEVAEYTAITDFLPGVDKFVIQRRSETISDVDYIYDTESPAFGEAHQFVNFDEGREIERSTFKHDADFFNDHVYYERETGSVLLYGTLIAHIEGNPKLTEADFLISYL